MTFYVNLTNINEIKKTCSPLSLVTSMYGLVELSYAISYILGCYGSYLVSLTCLDLSSSHCAKILQSKLSDEKIEMDMYCTTSKYLDGFLLHIWMN